MKKLSYFGLASLTAFGGYFLNATSAESATDPNQEGPAIRPHKQVDPPQELRGSEIERYREAIHKTAAMAGNGDAQSLANRLGLQVLNLTWEDTGRYKGSSVGPNISDMTIQVGLQNPANRQFEVSCMPVIRFPNFSDVSCDLDPRDFTVLVGNQIGSPLRRISLYDLLKDPTRYMHNPEEWKGSKKSLLAARDSKVLVSAQACFLPVPKSGKATFNPVLFNYQSYQQNPAVLTILATREGTSMTIIDNVRDGFSSGSAWGQRLFHNENGMRASFTGERISDFKTHSKPDPRNESSGHKSSESGMNMVLLIQVPLKQKEMRRAGLGGGGADFESLAAPAGATKEAAREKSDVENAVIGHGELEGPFTETDNLKIERDDRFPVRVTVQFYKATSNGVVEAQDLNEIKAQIDRVYAMSDFVGSLVTQGETGRVTEYDGCKIQPQYWWEDFWRRHYANTGQTREEAIAKLRKLLGDDYMECKVSELYVRDLLRKRK
jgi:hypothetical protein